MGVLHAVAAGARFLSGAPTVMEAASGATIDTFTGYGTSVLTWLISCFTSILSFMLSNPICFIWLIVSLIGTAFVFLRRTIGG